MAEPEKTDPEERIRKLEEKIRRLEEEGEESEGVAGSLLREVGGMFGLGGLLKGLEKSPAFQERLRAIEEEVERRFTEEPLKRTGEGRGGRRGPQVTGSFSVRTLADREPAPQRGRPKRRVKPEVLRPEEPAVDIFEEPGHLLVIAELPGVEETDIGINLEGDKLTISANSPHHRYRKQVTLPYSPKGGLKTAYKNGILEIRLEKA